MTSKITLTVTDDDAEPWLRAAAEDAAKFGAWCDYITIKTYNSPGRTGVALDDDKKRWRAKFLRGKRIVESFGVEYEQTSKEETLTVSYDYIGGKTRVVKVPGIGNIGMRSGSQPDYKHPRPCYASGIHAEACRQAADRVVRRWKAMIDQQQAA